MTRPALHLTTAAGWLNDPLGLTFRDGTYHLYFQHVPGQQQWAPSCHWGHATSRDLLAWSEREVALAPGDGDAGCWSGSVVTAEGGESVLFYTSVSTPDFAVGRVRTARPVTADLDVWRKDPGVAVALPDEVPARTFRDPFVFADGGRWWMLVGAGLADGTATALVYASDDLRSWEYRGRLAERHRDQREPVWTGSMWECPQVLRIGNRHVLVVSAWDNDDLHHVACAVGRFADGRFDVEAWHRLSWGGAHYAASAFRDRHGRPGLVFWLRGIADPAAGWAGAISLPYLLTLDGDRPRLVPNDTLEARRRDPEPARALEAVWRPAAPRDDLLLVDQDGERLARLHRDADRVTVAPGSTGPATEMTYAGGELRCLLDGPVLEVVGRAGVLAVRLRDGYRAARPVADTDDAFAWWSLDVVTPPR